MKMYMGHPVPQYGGPGETPGEDAEEPLRHVKDRIHSLAFQVSVYSRRNLYSRVYINPALISYLHVESRKTTSGATYNQSLY